MSKDHKKIILAFVGMPGAGKSETVSYLQKKGIPFVRFGKFTDEGVKSLGLELNPENERSFREKIRKELGMDVYAIKAKPLIDKLLENNNSTAIDGLYSWEEYVYLKNFFPNLILILVFANREIRYRRLSQRPIRPLTVKECYLRDLTEIEKLNKGGPIAMADYLMENNTEDLNNLHGRIDKLLDRLEIF